jgi:hypothetical protein
MENGSATHGDDAIDSVLHPWSSLQRVVVISARKRLVAKDEPIAAESSNFDPPEPAGFHIPVSVLQVQCRGMVDLMASSRQCAASRTRVIRDFRRLIALTFIKANKETDEQILNYLDSMHAKRSTALNRTGPFYRGLPFEYGPKLMLTWQQNRQHEDCASSTEWSQ